MSRKLKIGLGIGVVVIAALAAGFFFLFLRDDAPPPATLRTRSDAPAASGGGDVNGTWSVQPGDQVFVGYRMQEQFGGDTVEHTAVGRTPAVSGTMQIEGDKVTTASFNADLTQLSSDQVRRDRYIKSGGLETNQFPTATFVLSDPITLQSPAPGTEVNANATGDLTIHGVTKRVTIPLKARWNGDSIDISGGTGVVLADYGMHPPAVGGFVKTADHGTFELQLTFVRT
jgi:polyisoprenoid-binding protein YceI